MLSEKFYLFIHSLTTHSFTLTTTTFNNILSKIYLVQGLSWWWSDRISLPMQETRVQSLGRKIPWSRTWQSIPLFFLGQSKESWTWLSNWACTHAFCARHYASCLGCQELTKYGTWLQGVQLRFSRLKRKLEATLGTSIFVTLQVQLLPHHHHWHCSSLGS